MGLGWLSYLKLKFFFSPTKSLKILVWKTDESKIEGWGGWSGMLEGEGCAGCTFCSISHYFPQWPTHGFYGLENNNLEINEIENY